MIALRAFKVDSGTVAAVLRAFVGTVRRIDLA